MESPRHQRIAAYAAIKKESGSAELEEVKEAVKAEYMRKMEWKNNKSQKIGK
jgi:translation elongation factor EF-1beta